MQLIKSGKIGLNLSSLSGLAAGLKLSKKEERHFELLVDYSRAQTHEEKDKYYQRILSLRAQTSIKTIQPEKYQYFSQWYHSVVRELLVHPDYTGNPAWIAEKILPAVSMAKVKQSIQLLQKLDIVCYNAKKRKWQLTDTVISTPSEAPGIAIRSYHKKVTELARQTLNDMGESRGSFRSVTMGVDKQTYRKIQLKCKEIWEEVLLLSKTSQEVEDVYQVNIHMLPLTRPAKDTP